LVAEKEAGEKQQMKEGNKQKKMRRMTTRI